MTIIEAMYKIEKNKIFCILIKIKKIMKYNNNKNDGRGMKKYIM